MQSKHKTILLIISLSAIGFISLFSTYTDEDLARKDFEAYYKIYSLAIPKTNFCGEVVPINEPDVYERFDRELLTNVYWQSQTLLMIKRSEKHFDQISSLLKQENIPDDFKYLALAESGLQQVVSPSAAAGFWQLLEGTAKMYGLEINADVDERYHIKKSTQAACKYLHEAHKQFGNWSLVAASYNMGIEGLKKQLQFQQTQNFYNLWLNTETSRYLFRILALKEILSNPKKYGFNITQAHQYTNVETVEVYCNESIADLTTLATAYGCTYKDLKWHNPWLRTRQLNNASNKWYAIELPKNKVLQALNTTNVSDSIIYNPN